MPQTAPYCNLCSLTSVTKTGINLFKITLEISLQNIASQNDVYTINNIKPNMWFSNRSQGFAWRINSIDSINKNVLTCTIEDVDNYNFTINNGLNGPDVDPNVNFPNSYIFSLDYDGLPNLIPFDSDNKFEMRWATDIMNRFRSRNLYSNYVSIYQRNHNLNVGDFIYLDNGNFIKSTSLTDKIQDTLGLVTSVGITNIDAFGNISIDNDWFSFKPFGTFIKNDKITKTISGSIGSTFYLDVSGNYTNIPPTQNQYPVCVKINSQGDIILLNSRIRQNNTSSTTVSSQSATIDFYYNNGNLTKTIFTNGSTVLTNPITSNNKSINIPTNLTSFPKSIFIWGKQYNGSTFTWKITQCLTNSGLSCTFNPTDNSINLSAYSYSNLLGLLGILNPPSSSENLVAKIILNF